ncbi:hypothetical protein C0995_010022 [Termitomyces sp. Mi166|nr:hypothetical protein C0995_010022 [Termitomyces sp. Mi166\
MPMDSMKEANSIALTLDYDYKTKDFLVVDYAYLDETIFGNDKFVDSKSPTLALSADNPALACLYLTASEIFNSYVQENTKNKDSLLVTDSLALGHIPWRQRQQSPYHDVYAPTLLGANFSSTAPTASALAPALLTKLQRTPFLKLHCTAEHFLYLLLGLQAPIQFEQNQPSVEQWQNRARGHYEVAHKMLEDARRHFESVCQELQWVTMQHNAMALYLHDCDAVMNWHKMNNMELGEFSDTKDLPVTGGFPVIYPH